MAENELAKKLSLLERNFYQEMRKISQERWKLENESISDAKEKLLAGKDSGKTRIEIKPPVKKPFTIRLEPSLGEKLAKSKTVADDLEDKFQETRLAFEDKLKTVERMRAELDRRESVLVNSVQQIETYIRAVFYLKYEADDMHSQQKSIVKQRGKTLNQLLTELNSWESKKQAISKAIKAFLPAKLFVENIITDVPDYSTVRSLVDYYLVLETLQSDLVNREMQYAEEEDRMFIERQSVEQYRRRIPATVASKENTIYNLKTELKTLKSEVVQLENQVDDAIIAKARDDAAWCNLQRWVKNIFLTSIEIRPLRAEKPVEGVLDMLDALKEFVDDALQMSERLKDEMKPKDRGRPALASF